MHFCPALQAQVYPDPTNVKGGNLDMEIKLPFPQNCGEGPSSQLHCVQSLKGFLSDLFELLLNKGRKQKAVLPGWKNVLSPLFSYLDMAGRTCVLWVFLVF